MSARKETAMIVQHVLVPIDFSATADRALAYAIALAQQLQARLTLLHVLDMTEWPKYSKQFFTNGDRSRTTPTGSPLRRRLKRFQPILQRQIRDPCDVVRIIRHDG